MRPKPEFRDNIRVKRGNGWGGAEYLSVILEPEDDRKWEVCIRRYCVPGRCDTYCFYYNKSRGFGNPARIEYFSDGQQTILNSVKMVEKDLNNPKVVEMFVYAFSSERVLLYYRHDLMSLLYVLAPKSRTTKALEKLINKTLADRAERLVASGEISREVAKRVLTSI